MSLTLNKKLPQSGYTPCACRDCMDTTVSWDAQTPSRCSLCWEAGCEPFAPDSADYNALPGHMRECQRDDAYGEC
jgi:ribosomal protein S27E